MDNGARGGEKGAGGGGGDSGTSEQRGKVVCKQKEEQDPGRVSTPDSGKEAIF